MHSLYPGLDVPDMEPPDVVVEGELRVERFLGLRKGLGQEGRHPEWRKDCDELLVHFGHLPQADLILPDAD
jgi:hypothetical protein